jgi:hypothetical protein
MGKIKMEFEFNSLYEVGKALSSFFFASEITKVEQKNNKWIIIVNKEKND